MRVSSAVLDLLLEAQEEVDLDRLLWVPGQRKIFIPAVKPAPIDWGLDTCWYEDIIVSRDVYTRGAWNYLCECVPSRGQFLQDPTQQIQDRYLPEIRVPIRQNYRAHWGRDW